MDDQQDSATCHSDNEADSLLKTFVNNDTTLGEILDTIILDFHIYLIHLRFSSQDCMTFHFFFLVRKKIIGISSNGSIFLLLIWNYQMQ